MSNQVTIVDYGIGNIFSVAKALEISGATVELTDKPADILNAAKLVLPGVGAFFNGMKGLSDRDLIEPIQKYANSGRPMLGICLGMQMLFNRSFEFGEHFGLGIIEGDIVPIFPKDQQGMSLKVPHIGWSPLQHPPRTPSWDGSILSQLNEGEACYFVHSYTAVPEDEGNRLSDTWYGDSRISAAVRKGNVYGCQFHPEKSGPAGLKIIKSFLEI